MRSPGVRFRRVLPLPIVSSTQSFRQRGFQSIISMSEPHLDGSVDRDDEHRKALLKRMQEILVEHDGGPDAGATRAINTVGWEKAW